MYNLWVLSGSGKFFRDAYVNPYLDASSVRQNRIVSAYYRLQTTKVNNTIASATGGPCRALTSTEQIGCLVKASACSIGFASRGAVAFDNTNMAFQIGENGKSIAFHAHPASNRRVESLLTGFETPYALAGTLWFNGYLAYDPNAGPFFLCTGSATVLDATLVSHNLVPVPSQLPDGTPITINRLKTCPAVFP